MTIWEGFEALKGYVDSSDPDSDLPNMEHMLQTAESIRAAGHPDWMILTGLLHDMGKSACCLGQTIKKCLMIITACLPACKKLLHPS